MPGGGPRPRSYRLNTTPLRLGILKRLMRNKEMFTLWRSYVFVTWYLFLHPIYKGTVEQRPCQEENWTLPHSHSQSQPNTCYGYGWRVLRRSISLKGRVVCVDKPPKPLTIVSTVYDYDPTANAYSRKLCIKATLTYTHVEAVFLKLE